nr:hypothetical protein CFP56_13041 [Quercus suber]
MTAVALTDAIACSTDTRSGSCDDSPEMLFKSCLTRLEKSGSARQSFLVIAGGHKHVRDIEDLLTRAQRTLMPRIASDWGTMQAAKLSMNPDETPWLAGLLAHYTLQEQSSFAGQRVTALQAALWGPVEENVFIMCTATYLVIMNSRTGYLLDKCNQEKKENSMSKLAELDHSPDKNTKSSTKSPAAVWKPLLPSCSGTCRLVSPGCDYFALPVQQLL